MTDQEIVKVAFNPGINKYLIGALAGGLGAGGLSALTSAHGKERPGESPEERRNRIIRNALGMGAGGAAVGAGIPLMLDSIATAAPTRSPAEEAALNIPREGAAAVGAALGGITTPGGSGLLSKVDDFTALSKQEAAIVDAANKANPGWQSVLEAERYRPKPRKGARPLPPPPPAVREALTRARTTADTVDAAIKRIRSAAPASADAALKRLGIRSAVGAGIGFAAPELAQEMSKGPAQAGIGGGLLGTLLTSGRGKLIGAPLGAALAVLGQQAGQSEPPVEQPGGLGNILSQLKGLAGTNAQ